MPMGESQIKVSSIRFTDIVDSSKMVQKDQALTLQLVEEHNQIIKGCNQSDVMGQKGLKC
jgi:hypothetical protein